MDTLDLETAQSPPPPPVTPPFLNSRFAPDVYQGRL